MTPPCSTRQRPRSPRQTVCLCGALSIVCSAGAWGQLDPAQELRDEQDRARRLQRIEDVRPLLAPATEPDLRAGPATVADPQAVLLSRLMVEDTDGLLPAEELDAILTTYRALPMGPARLSLLVRQLQAAVVANGFITSRAAVKKTDWPSGEVVLVLVPGRLQDIRMTDGQDVTAGVRLAIPLASGDVIRLPDVEQGVRQINRLRRLQAKLRIEPSSVARDHHDLVIDLQRLGHAWGQVSVDNHGARATGEARFKSSVFVEDALGLLDATGLIYAHTAKTRALLATSSVPQGHNTWTVGASASESSQPVLGEFRLEGRSSSLNAGWNRVLVLSAHRQDTVTASFTHNASTRTFEGVRLQPERLSVVRGAYASTWRSQAAQGYAELAYARGLDALGARRATWAAWTGRTPMPSSARLNCTWRCSGRPPASMAHLAPRSTPSTPAAASTAASASTWAGPTPCADSKRAAAAATKAGYCARSGNGP